MNSELYCFLCLTSRLTYCCPQLCSNVHLLRVKSISSIAEHGLALKVQVSSPIVINLKKMPIYRTLSMYYGICISSELNWKMLLPELKKRNWHRLCNEPSVCRVRWRVPPTPSPDPLTARRRSGCSRASHTAGRTTTGRGAWACAPPSCDRASSSPAVGRADATLAPAPAVSESRSAAHGYTHLSQKIKNTVYNVKKQVKY